MTGEDTAPKKRSGCLKWVAIVVGILVVLGIIGAIAGEPPKSGEQAATGNEQAATVEDAPKAEAKEAPVVAATPTPSAMRVSATELFQAYDANEAAAQEKYGDKQLLVSGKVAGIDLDFMNKPVVMLRTPNEFMNAQASLVEQSQASAKTLSKGQNVELLCGSVGEVMGTPMLRDCAIQ